MLKMPRPVLPLILAALSISACSWYKDKPPEYLASEEGAPLEVPDDLDDVRTVRPIFIRGDKTRMPSGDELNPGPPRAANTQGGGEPNAFLAWSANGVYLMVKDSQASVAGRLGPVIENSGMSMLESNVEGRYKFEYTHPPRKDDRGFFQKMLFWRGDDAPDYSGTYVTYLEEDGDKTRVYLMNDTGRSANTNAAQHILGIFMERLG